MYSCCGGYFAMLLKLVPVAMVAAAVPSCRAPGQDSLSSEDPQCLASNGPAMIQSRSNVLSVGADSIADLLDENQDKEHGQGGDQGQDSELGKDADEEISAEELDARKAAEAAISVAFRAAEVGKASRARGAEREAAITRIRQRRAEYAAHRQNLTKVMAALNASQNPANNELENMMKDFADHQAASQDKCPALLLEAKHQLNVLHEHIHELAQEINATEMTLETEHIQIEETYEMINNTHKWKESEKIKCKVKEGQDLKMYWVLKAELLEMHQIANPSWSAQRVAQGKSATFDYAANHAAWAAQQGGFAGKVVGKAIVSTSSSTGSFAKYATSSTTASGYSSASASGMASASSSGMYGYGMGGMGASSGMSSGMSVGMSASGAYMGASGSGFGSPVGYMPVSQQFQAPFAPGALVEEKHSTGKKTDKAHSLLQSDITDLAVDADEPEESKNDPASIRKSRALVQQTKKMAAELTACMVHAKEARTAFLETDEDGIIDNLIGASRPPMSAAAHGKQVHGHDGHQYPGMPAGYNPYAGMPAGMPGYNAYGMPAGAHQYAGQPAGAHQYAGQPAGAHQYAGMPVGGQYPGGQILGGHSASSSGQILGGHSASSASSGMFGSSGHSTTTSGHGATTTTSGAMPLGMTSGGLYGSATTTTGMGGMGYGAYGFGSGGAVATSTTSSSSSTTGAVYHSSVHSSSHSKSVVHSSSHSFMSKYTTSTGNWVPSSASGTGGAGAGASPECQFQKQSLQVVYVRAYVEITRLLAEYENLIHSKACDEYVEEVEGQQEKVLEGKVVKMTKTVLTFTHKLEAYRVRIQQSIKIEMRLRAHIQTLAARCRDMDATVSSLDKVRDAIHMMGVCPGLGKLTFHIPKFTGKIPEAAFDLIDLTDAQIDEALNALCKSEVPAPAVENGITHLIRAAESSELLLRAVDDLPATNTGATPLIGLCPNCEGVEDESDGVQHASGHSRVCWDPTKTLDGANKRNDCSTKAKKSVVCVEEITYANEPQE